MSLKTGRRTNVGGKVGLRPHTSAGAVRVNNYNPSSSRHRRVPRGIRRAPVGRIPKGYTPVDKLSMSLPLSVRENVLPTILPVGRERAAPIESHDVPIREDWSKLFRQSKIVAKTQAQLKEKQYQVTMSWCCVRVHHHRGIAPQYPISAHTFVCCGKGAFAEKYGRRRRC